jgi:ABC-type xylose transport system permease subunit
MEIQTFYTLMHLIGVAIGAGGAYMSDIMFMFSVKDNRINHTEFKFLQLGSTIVWIGIFILVISGGLLFSISPDFYLQSDKFLSKMSIVFILIINGIFFHKYHMPVIRSHKDTEFNKVSHMRKARAWLVYSGVISMTSWTFALILGAWRGIPYPYLEIMLTYLIFIVAGLICGRIIFHKRFML